MPINPRTGAALLCLALLSAYGAAFGPGAHAASLEGEVVIWQPGLLFGETVVEDRSNAVVFVAGFTEPPPRRKLELAQQDKSFSLRVLALTQGESVTFPNRDPFHHNVWSKSKARSFDLGLYKAPESKTVDFPRPGIITVFCNIHAQMIATILVLPNTRFAVTGPDGTFRIDGVPPGKHSVFAWVEGSTPVRQMVEFRDGEAARADFRLQLKRIPLDHLNKDGKPYRKEEYRGGPAGN